MNGPKVDRETAEAEVQKWLENKRIRGNKLESFADNIESLVECVMYGQLLIEEDFSWTHILDIPIPGDVPMEKLSYKPRLTVQETHSKMKGVKGTDVDGRVVALVAALTGKPSALIGKLDTSDYSVAQNIAIFFL